MSDDLRYIDEFYKNSLLNLEEKAGKDVWKRLYWSLFWLRYKWLVLTGLVVLVGIAGFLVLSTSLRNRQITESMETVEPTVLNSNKINQLNTEMDYNNPSAVSSTQKPVVTFDAPKQSPQPAALNKVDASEKQTNSKNVGVATNGDNSVSTKVYRTTSLEPLAKIDLASFVILQPDTIVLGENRKVSNVPAQAKQNRFMVTVFGGFGYSIPAISGFNNDYTNYRNNHEFDKPGWSAGVDLRYRVKKWAFGIGLNLSRYNRYRDYKYTFNEYDPDKSYFDYDTTFVWIYDAPVLGKPMVKSIDSTWVEVYSDITNDYSGYNYISYFEIPLFIGYRFQTGRLAIEPGMGFSVGFLTGSYYKIPLESINSIEPVEVSNMNKIMLNYFASVTFNYKISRKFSITFQPVYKQNLKSVFGSNFPVTEKYKTFGVNLGIGFEF